MLYAPWLNRCSVQMKKRTLRIESSGADVCFTSDRLLWFETSLKTRARPPRAGQVAGGEEVSETGSVPVSAFLTRRSEISIENSFYRVRYPWISAVSSTLLYGDIAQQLSEGLSDVVSYIMISHVFHEPLAFPNPSGGGLCFQWNTWTATGKTVVLMSTDVPVPSRWTNYVKTLPSAPASLLMIHVSIVSMLACLAQSITLPSSLM